MLECARMEKHTLTSFTNLLHRQMTPELGDRDPDAEIAASIQSAIDNPEASVDDLKATLKQAQKLYQPNIDLYVPPVDHKSWMRFRNSVSAFYEVCTNPVVSMNSQAEMYIKNQELKEHIAEIYGELEVANGYRERFEALEKSQAPEYEKILKTTKAQLTRERIEVVNLRAEVEKQKKVIHLYKRFSEGAFNKDALIDQLYEMNAVASAFSVKLKKVNVTKEENEKVPEAIL
jgi:hypothetical protein